jgi:nonsense-mediated mRNA decay protein 3
MSHILNENASKEVLIQLTAPCYLCGKKSVVDGLCSECYNQQHPLIEVPTPITLQVCKKCGSVKVPGGWLKISTGELNKDEVTEREIEVILQQEIKILGEDVTLALEEEKKLDRVSHLVVIATGKSHKDLPDYDEYHPVEIRFSYGTCDTCGMMSGGYYEAILQIRADDREISDTEKREFTQIVTDMTVAKYKSDDKAFVTLIDDNKYGIDYYIGSEHLAKSLSDEFQSRYIAERKENYKLVGEDKTGKRKYRITILIRLPRFSIGDFVLIDEQPCQVLEMGRNSLTCFNLIKRERFTISPRNVKWRSLQYLAPVTDRREFMIVTHVFGQPIQIMDSESFEVSEIEESVLDSEITSGAKIHGFFFEDQLYILPDQTSIKPILG